MKNISYDVRRYFDVYLNSNIFQTKCFVVYRNGLLVVKEEFFRIPPQQTWTAWTIDLLIKKPVSWTFNKVSNFVFNSMKMVSEDILYVHIGACKVGGMSESRLPFHSTL